MKAAIVTEAGKTPVYGEFREAEAQDGEVVVEVSAAALSPLVKGRAAGTHYSSSGQLPFVVGVDGVGRLEDGRRVYFALPRSPFGAMSERTVIHPSQCAMVPEDLDDVTAAAIANPGMSSWAALKERAKFVAGETVLVNGATGTAGRLAVQIAKHMGAKKVVATGRNVEVLKSLSAFGADVTIPLGDSFEEVFREGIDVVLDYLWGESAERIIAAGAKAGSSMRFVQIGSGSGGVISLPGSALRSSPITLMGSGIGSVPPDRLVAAIGELLAATVGAGLEIATREVPLSEVEEVWGDGDGGARVVFRVS